MILFPGYTNQQAVEMLRSTGQMVKLKLIRYVRGLKFEQLQQAIANSQNSPRIQHHNNEPQMIRTDSVISEESASAKEDDLIEPPIMKLNFEGEISPETEAALIKEWSNIMNQYDQTQYEIVVAQMSKFKPNGGLGISLEGTVEKVDGAEQNPHHYIRSVLPDGKCIMLVGRNIHCQMARNSIISQ